MLTAKAAQNFSLALHELAANAAKYGALSNGLGRVHVSWSVASDNGSGHLTFRWKESDGPPVTAPKRIGFGNVVLEQVMGEYFYAPPRLEFAPEGVRYELNGSVDGMIADGRS